MPGFTRGWLSLAALLASLGAAGAARGENWPGWRGPRGDGVSRESDVPLDWSPTRNIVWKTPLPGVGHSSPIIWGDSVFVTTAIPDELKRELLRIDRKTGKVLWRRTVLTAPLEPIHPLNSYSSSTPATDGQTVYVAFLDKAEMLVAAYDWNGNKRWEVRPGPFASKHGFCTNPVLYQDRVLVNGDHDGDAYLAMLRKEDGSIVWKTPRENRTRSYSTPIIAPIGGKELLMLTGSLCTAGYDIATGKKVWTCDGPSEQMVATLVHNRDLIFSLGGYPQRHLLAIRKDGLVGDVTKSHILWRTHKAVPYVPSPILYGDFLHVVSDDGIYTCYDPPTGKALTQQRAMKHTSSSILGAAGRVYLTDDTGATVVIKNSGGFEKLSQNQLGEDVFSTPSISQGDIYIRGAQHLFRIGAGGERNLSASRD